MRNHKLKISTASKIVKFWEPAYSQAPSQNKLIGRGSQSSESGRQAGRQSVRRLRQMLYVELKQRGRYEEG